MAGELIQLYAARKRQSGYAFSADAPWQKEFEDNFPYPETDDQLRCIADIKKDMESPIPMDRLLCGDVGFGKTEVALRAVMKAVMDGQAGGHSGAHHGACPAALPDRRVPVPGLPGDH